jgi:hypothetical protein
MSVPPSTTVHPRVYGVFLSELEADHFATWPAFVRMGNSPQPHKGDTHAQYREAVAILVTLNRLMRQLVG